MCNWRLCPSKTSVDPKPGVSGLRAALNPLFTVPPMQMGAVPEVLKVAQGKCLGWGCTGGGDLVGR